MRVELNLFASFEFLFEVSRSDQFQSSRRDLNAVRTVCKSNFEKRNRKFDGVRDNRFCYLRFVESCWLATLSVVYS